MYAYSDVRAEWNFIFLMLACIMLMLAFVQKTQRCASLTACHSHYHVSTTCLIRRGRFPAVTDNTLRRNLFTLVAVAFLLATMPQLIAVLDANSRASTNESYSVGAWMTWPAVTAAFLAYSVNVDHLKELAGRASSLGRKLVAAIAFITSLVAATLMFIWYADDYNSSAGARAALGLGVALLLIALWFFAAALMGYDGHMPVLLAIGRFQIEIFQNLNGLGVVAHFLGWASLWAMGFYLIWTDEETQTEQGEGEGKPEDQVQEFKQPAETA